jgi:hypothetical protein
MVHDFKLEHLSTVAASPEKSSEESQGSVSPITGNSLDSTVAAKVRTIQTSAYIPLKCFLIKEFNNVVTCRGCSQSFPCYFTPKESKKIPCPSFYIHCIDECSEYLAKYTVQICEYCHFKFLDSESVGIHRLSCRKGNRRNLLATKPKWMPTSTMLTIMNYSKFESEASCRGCNSKFPCYRKGHKVVPSLEYYIHCIEECEEYREKGYVRVCSGCCCKFLNPQALAQHKRGCFGATAQNSIAITLP